MRSQRGKGSEFTEEIAAQIAERLSNGEPLAQVCRDDGMPGLRTVYDWMEEREDFAARIARARHAGYDHIAQDALNIADTPMEGEIRKESEDGVEITRKDMLEHRKLRVWTRLQLLAKWDPKRYGERIEHDVTTRQGEVSDQPASPEEWEQRHGGEKRVH